MRPRHDVQTVADKCRIVYKKGNFVETFSDKTEVSFRQLFKKDGWFSRLVVLHLIVIPIYTSIFYTFKSIRTPIPPNHPAPYILHLITLLIGFIFIAPHLAIGFLLWKKRTRSTITVSIALLWITFAVKRVLGVFVSILTLVGTLYSEEVNAALINRRIYGLIYTISFAILFLVLTIVWTRNLKRLRSLCP